jgi:sarcosine oxidase
VVGAGILGLSAARSLARRGLDVLVLEAEAPGHPRSGSKGDARIFRLSYPDALYVRMAMEAHRLWRTLEAESGAALLHETGQVSFGEDLATLAGTMRDAGAPFTELSSDEVGTRFPDLRVSGPALFEERSGVLVADACLRALCGTAEFELRQQSPVDQIREQRGGALVLLNDADAALSADVVLNCAGHHALSIMDGVRARAGAPATLQQVAYLQAREPGPPATLFIEWGPSMVYGLPVIGRDLLKLSHHTQVTEWSADEADQEDDPELLALLQEAAGRLLPTYSPVPVATERCIYDNSIDTDFIIDRVGHIVVGCGTSGHGFKFGPLLGELMADLALGSEPSFPLDRFALGRSFLRLLPDG